jgi:alpha/beta superfamily hydrolase
MTRVLSETGYAVLVFDYQGWGDSEGPMTRLACRRQIRAGSW